MAGPGDEIAAGAGGRGRLRASHADREQVVGTLKAAFVAGMLAKDEFDSRVGQALASRTYAQLAVLTADLPAGLAAASFEPARAGGGGELVLRPGQLSKWASTLYAAGWAAILAFNPGEHTVVLPLFLVMGTLVYLGVLIIAVAVAAENRRDRRPGGQLPWGQAPGAGGPALRRLPSTGLGEQLPPEGPGHRHNATAARRRRARRPLPVRGPCAGGALATGTVPAGG